MKKTRHFVFSAFSILLIIGLSLVNAGTVLADEGVPTDIPMTEPTDPPIEETLEPEATLPPEEITATPAPEEPATDLLAQVPENTDVVVLDENGESISLATQDAADAIVSSDPMWCPEGTLPNGAGCVAFASGATPANNINALLTAMRDNAGDYYSRNGVIYFERNVTFDTSFILDDTASSLGSSYTTLSTFNITLQGGWTGGSSQTINDGQSTFDNNSNAVIRVGSSGNPWQGAVRVEDFIIQDNTTILAPSLAIYTTSTNGDITVDNVNISNIQNSTGALISSTSGDITLNDLDLHAGRGQVGLDVSTNGGNVVLTDIDITDHQDHMGLNVLSANGNVLFDDVDVLNQHDNYAAYVVAQNGNITVQNGSIFDSSSFEPGLGLSATAPNGSITISNTRLTDSMASGATLSSPILTLNSVIANHNADNGITINNANVVTLNNVTATNNGTNIPGDGWSNDIGSGVLVNGTGSTQVLLSGGVFNNNRRYGIEVYNTINNALYVTSTPECSGNGSGSCYNVTAIFDSVKPTITASISSGTPGNPSWYTSNVTVHFTCADNAGGSGIATGACPADQILSTEGTSVSSASQTVTDLAGNTSAPSNVIAVNIDKTAPSLTLPNDFLVEATSLAGATITYSASVSDNIDMTVTMTCSPDSGTNFPFGITTVNCSSTDQAGNTGTGSFTVTVGDTKPPKLTLPANITQEAVGPAGNVVTFSATSKDTLDGSVPVTCSPASGSTFALGTTTVDCSATDAAGNMATGSFTVTIRDTTAPALSLPANIVEEAVSPVGNAVSFSATSTDIVDGSISVSCTPASGSTFGVTATTVTCSATDAAGNTATGSFTVTIRDTTAPTLSLLTNIMEEAAGPAGNVVSFIVTSSDIVGGSVPVTCSPASGSTFALGTTTVDCSATDAAGNTGTGSFTVTVHDTTGPALSLPANIIQEAVGPSGNVVSFTATATDVVDGSLPVTCNSVSGSTFALGTTTVSCSATDSSQNTTTDTFTVSIEDTTAPILSLPSNITQEAVGPAGNVVTFTATASDIVAGSLMVTCTPASGSTFAITTTTVTCSATDSAENTVTDTFTVTVQDTTAPVIASHPDVFIKTSFPDGEDVYYGAPSTSDIVDGGGLATCSPASGSIFPVGDTVVICTAVDAHGNAATPVTFTVHVFEAQTYFAGGADLLIPLTGSSSFTLACKNPQSFHVATESARIFFNNLCGYDALVEGLESASLPGKLPSGASFIGGFTIDVLKADKAVDQLPKNAKIVLEFDLESDFNMEDYSAFVWNGKAWVEVKGEKTADGYFSITLTEGGSFIIVKK